MAFPDEAVAAPRPAEMRWRLPTSGDCDSSAVSRAVRGGRSNRENARARHARDEEDRGEDAPRRRARPRDRQQRRSIVVERMHGRRHLRVRRRVMT